MHLLHHGGLKIGPSDPARTGDLLLPKQALITI